MITNKISNLTQNKRVGMLFLSVVIVALLLLITWKFCPLCIHNNDDKILMYLTAGYATGEPEMASAFGSFYWYGLISIFYKVYPKVAWYTIFQLIALISSLAIICYSFLYSSDSGSIFIGGIFFIGAYLCSLLFFSAALQYTATVGIVGGASVCLMVIGCDEEKIINFETLGSLVFLVMAYGLRRQFGIVTLSALLIVVVFRSSSFNYRLLLHKALLVLLVFSVAYASNFLYEIKSGMNEFNRYYAEAGKWNDYPHLQYEGNEDIYESAGWDETLYEAASDWFFMDENVNITAFKIINDNYDEHLSVREFKERAHNLLASNSLANGQVVLWLIMFVLYNAISLFKKNEWRRILCADSLFVLFSAVVFYFILKGRLPFRAYQSLIYIYAMPFIALFLDSITRLCKVQMRIICTAIILICCVAIYNKNPESNMIRLTMATCNDAGRINDQSQFESLDKYAIAHGDNIYIYDSDLANPIGAFTVYTEYVPTNLMQWGGWQYNMPTYWKQLYNNGFSTMGLEQFFEDNVFFCSRGDLETLQKYVRAREPHADMELVDTVNGVNIFKFTR